jgi:integrase
MRHRIRSPQNTRRAANIYEGNLRKKLAEGIDIDAHEIAPPKFSAFSEQWFEDYVVANNKPSEQRTKKYILSASLVPFFGNKGVQDIAAQDIEQYKTKLLEQGVSQKTVNNRLTVLRSCLAAAYEWLKLAGAPPKTQWLKCPPPKTDYLSADECSLLLKNAEGIVHELILLALRTGMRQGEIRGLQWSAIDWQARLLIVRHTLCDYTKELGSPKSNRERVIPLDRDVWETLFHRKKATGYVFLDTDGVPFNERRLVRRLAAARKKAGLRPFGWHTLRHTFATHLAMAGAPPSVIQALLGHSSILTTMRYTHATASGLRSAIDLLNPKTALDAQFGQPAGNTRAETVPRTNSVSGLAA